MINKKVITYANVFSSCLYSSCCKVLLPEQLPTYVLLIILFDHSHFSNISCEFFKLRLPKTEFKIIQVNGFQLK